MTKVDRRDHQRAATYFDKSGALFDSLYSPEKLSPVMRFMNRRFRRDIFDRYMQTLNHLRLIQARSVLDVGIGGGRYAEGYLGCGVKRVVGVDISVAMLESAREHISHLPQSAGVFEFIQSDIVDFQTAEQFDVVVAMGFFDYVTDPLECLRKFFLFCRHSIIASFPSTSLYRTPIRRMRYKLKNCPIYFFKRDQIERLSREAGFVSCTVVKIRGAGMDYVATFFK